MPEVNNGGISAQDAGKAPQETDLSVVAPELNNATDKQQEEAAKASDDTTEEEAQEEAKEEESAQESEESEEGAEENSEEESGEESEEEPTEDGKAEYLKQKQEKHAAKKIQEVSQKLTEAQKRLEAFENVQETMVRNNVNHLYVLAQTDKSLADKMVSKIFGQTHGVETLEELKLLADRNKADDRHKPLYDTQLATMKELRELRQEREERRAAQTQTEISSFKSVHPEFKGDLQKKTLEIRDRSKGAFSLEESFQMARGLVTVDPKASEQAAVKVATNKAGARGGQSNVGMGKGKILTQEQVQMAKRFKLDPKKVY